MTIRDPRVVALEQAAAELQYVEELCADQEPHEKIAAAVAGARTLVDVARGYPGGVHGLGGGG